MRSRAAALHLGHIAALAVACADADPPGATRLEYGACPADLPGETAGRDCAVASAPLLSSEPDGEQIDLMVGRYRAASGARGQLWLLDGGPGGTGAGTPTLEDGR